MAGAGCSSSRSRGRSTGSPQAKRELPPPGRCIPGAVGDRPLAEIELVGLAQSGDSAAYQTLVEEHQTIAFRTAYLITGSAADAEEAVQEAFVKAFYALGRFRPDAPFRPWVLRIVANEDRLVIACRYFLELSEEETAAALDWRRGTVKSRLARALERLRARMEVEV